MREIKFRGKRVDTKEWVHGYLLITESIGNLEPLHYFICPIKNEGMYRVMVETIGQYTGLKDKNGKEIYEGDIVCWINSDGESVHSVVEFVDGAFRIHNACFTLWDYLDNDAEVIGNIHEVQKYEN